MYTDINGFIDDLQACHPFSRIGFPYPDERAVLSCKSWSVAAEKILASVYLELDEWNLGTVLLDSERTIARCKRQFGFKRLWGVLEMGPEFHDQRRLSKVIQSALKRATPVPACGKGEWNLIKGAHVRQILWTSGQLLIYKQQLSPWLDLASRCVLTGHLPVDVTVSGGEQVLLVF